MSRKEISPETIAARFAESGFIAAPEVATSLFLADALGKPLLLEGPPGVGKTEIAKLWAQYHDAELIRLQCYEGLDEAKALYEWSYGKQMLYAQLLRDKTGEILGRAADLAGAIAILRDEADGFFSRDFLLPRPLLQAILTKRPAVLLVDEVDRSDEEFEAFLLEVLSDHQVSIPELGTLKAAHPPRVVLTSNDTRELSDALRRRCLYLYVDYPTTEDEIRIVEARVPGISVALTERLVRFAQSLRKADLKKAPGIAEVVDWALALVAVGADGLSAGALKKTLGALLKNREDVERVLADPSRFRG
ncbi:MAG TPA: MoxR family ATPase [Candidatus Polarisedimenticolaceae bacterium]|nr:MoxR family ATPase [Candidatus Polarisedimenticolaceae bacterium]